MLTQLDALALGRQKVRKSLFYISIKPGPLT